MAIDASPNWWCSDPAHNRQPRGTRPRAIGVVNAADASDARKVPRCQSCIDNLASSPKLYEVAYLLHRLRRAPQHDLTPDLQHVRDFLDRAVDHPAAHPAN